jgi:hypothetical protein
MDFIEHRSCLLPSTERNRPNTTLMNEIFDRLLHIGIEQVTSRLNVFVRLPFLTYEVLSIQGSARILSTFTNDLARTGHTLSIVSNNNQSIARSLSIASSCSR